MQFRSPSEGRSPIYTFRVDFWLQCLNGHVFAPMYLLQENGHMIIVYICAEDIFQELHCSRSFLWLIILMFLWMLGLAVVLSLFQQ